ncbi:hypothetical protein [Cupriavidus sp. CP313]
MRDIAQQIAAVMCDSDSKLDRQAWLQEEAYHLALRIAGLDEIPAAALLPLAQLAANGEMDVSKLLVATGLENPELEEYLEALCELRFAETTWNGYKATRSGEDAFKAVGSQIVVRVRYEMKRRFEAYDFLYQQLNELSPSGQGNSDDDAVQE